MKASKIPWQVRSIAAGTAGTAAMTLAYATERRLRHVAAAGATDDTLRRLGT